MLDRPTLPRQPLALIISGHEWSARSLESVLAPHGYGILRAHDGAEAFQRMAIAEPDLVLIDDKLPDLTVTEVCRRIRLDPRVSPNTPIIVTTAGPWPRQERLETLRAGAWDIVGLPVDAEELLLRLNGYMRARFQAPPRQAEDLLDHETGLYNSRGVLRLLEELASGAFRYARPFACVIFSPDRGAAEEAPSPPLASTSVNRVAQVLRSTSRSSDALGRLSDDEFVVLAPETDADGVIRMAQRLANAVEAPDSRSGDEPLRLRAGCYAVPNFRNASIEPVEMIVRATLALRRAQTDGSGDRIQVFDPIQPMSPA
ncbi:MAG: diguanylate cyclase [Gemmatimonadetes bacterium]|nr:diguanylate cyclase [Gemmatimonadota bacterium]